MKTRSGSIPDKYARTITNGITIINVTGLVNNFKKLPRGVFKLARKFLNPVLNVGSRIIKKISPKTIEINNEIKNEIPNRNCNKRNKPAEIITERSINQNLLFIEVLFFISRIIPIITAIVIKKINGK
jgi:hypothetical protein